MPTGVTAVGCSPYAPWVLLGARREGAAVNLDTAAPTPAVPARGAARTARRLILVAAVWAAAWFDSFHLAANSPLQDFFDLRVYRGAVLWWLHGGHLYAFLMPHTAYGFTYPPFAAICMLPLAWLGLGAAVGLVTFASTAVVVVLTWWFVSPVAQAHGWSQWFVTALAVPAVLALDPIRQTLGFGQINMLVFALVIGDVVALRRGARWAGAGIGLATALKVTPGLFVVFLLLAGRRRAAAVATATFLAATLLAFAVSGSTSTEFWTRELWNTSRVGHLDRSSNQSVLGALARLAYPAEPSHVVWLALAGIVLAVGLRRAVRSYRAGDDLTAVTLVGLTACLVSPIAWTHHLYWVVPALAFLISLVWVVAQNRHDGGALWMLTRDSFGLLFLALVVLLPVRAARGGERSPARPRPGGSSPR